MLKLLTPLLTSLAAGEVGLAVSRAKHSAIFAVVIAVLAGIGLIFLLIAAYIALAARYGDLHSALILAGSAFGLAVIAYVIMKISAAAARKRQHDRAKVDTSTLLTIVALAVAPTVLRSRALLALAVPLVALGGLSLAGKKKRRRQRRRDVRSAGDGV